MLGAITYGLVVDVASLTFERFEILGHVMLRHADAQSPLATIATNVVLIPLGAIAVWHGGSAHLLIGSLFMLVVSFVFTAPPWSLLVGNGAELVFALALLLSAAPAPHIALHSLRQGVLFARDRHAHRAS